MSFFKNNEPDNEMADEEYEKLFAKVPVRPLIAANCTDFVVAHAKTPLRPVRQVSEVFLLPHILGVMHKLGLNKLLRVQSHTWGHLIADRGHGALVVAGPRSGRTLSYIPPVCDVVGRTMLEIKAADDRNRYGHVVNGPLALILVPDLERVRRVNALCYAFLRDVSHSKHYSLILTIPSSPKTEFFHRLLNGVGCLVATPAQLVWVFKHWNQILFQGLKVVVYDDIDLMDLEMLSQAEKGLSKLIRYDEPHPQLVVISQRYDHLQMAKLKLLNENPAVIFGDMLEAAMYGEMRLQIALRNGQDKVKEVVKLLKQRPPKDYRTVIFCSDDADMRRLVKLLEEHFYTCLPYYQDSNLLVGEQVHRWLANTRGIILLVTDNCPELSIRNAHTLIHYSMSSSWGKFKMRHLAVSGNVINKLDRNSLARRQKDALQLLSLVLLDDTNQRQLPRLVDFVRQHQRVDEDIVAVANQIRKEMASLEPSQNVVCRQIMTMGDCINTSCEERHLAGPADHPTAWVPTSGDIKLRLVRVYSPTHFCVYLLEHLPTGQSWKAFPSLAAEQIRRQLLQGDGNERYWPPIAGDVCLCRLEEHKVRVRVLKVEPIKNVNLSVSNLGVLVQVMDEDTRVLSVHSGRLYKCPEELQAKPPMAIDLRLLGMVPYSGDRQWSEEDRRAIEYKLRNLPDQCFLQANVELATAHTIFVRNLVVIAYASSMRMHVRRLSLVQFLTENKMAKSCQQARDKILEFFEDVTGMVEELQLKESSQELQLQESSRELQLQESSQKLQLQEETKENKPPNKPGKPKEAPIASMPLGLEYVPINRRQSMVWKQEQEARAVYEVAKKMEQQRELEAREAAQRALEAREAARALEEEQRQQELLKKTQDHNNNNDSLSQLLECIENMAHLNLEDDPMPDEDTKQMLKGASKLLDHLEIGSEAAQEVKSQPKKSRKRKEGKYPTDFKVTPPRDPSMQLGPAENVVRPPTTYYETRTTLELHVLLPDESYEYSALLANNTVFFHASHRSSELSHQFCLPLGVTYFLLQHYMRGRTVYMSVKKTLAIPDPLNFVHYSHFLKPNHEKFGQMNSEEQVDKFTTYDERMVLLTAKYFEDENNNNSNSGDEDNADGIERADKYKQYED